jgi:hypothetical protein
MFEKLKLNDVFVPGGQPSVTYVRRDDLGIEEALRKAISEPSNIISLTGSTKSGKTVLCRKVLEDFEYVWTEGGQTKTEADVWNRVCYELNYPAEIMKATGSQTGLDFSLSGGAESGIPANKVNFTATAGGSRLKSVDSARIYRIDSMQTALDHLKRHGICLVIDDFHYIPESDRASLIRTLKGAVFGGLKVVLLSTPHRAFEAIRAEAEVTGRFKHVTVPPWNITDLTEIATAGFRALNADCPSKIIAKFAGEAEQSPLLMQKFCWNICYDSKIAESTVFNQKINGDFDLTLIFNEVAKDSGLPIYEKLAKGPQTRTERIMRPLRRGGAADIYQAILLATAVTGPKAKLTYDQIRTSLNQVLADKVPQKLEVSNALNHLANIDREENKGDRAIDWDPKALVLVITDPFFRFYLRWKVARENVGLTNGLS